MLESSGDTDFDAAALAAIETGLKGGSPPELQGGPPPAWSRWRFRAQIYRWSRGELILDPQFAFDTPGREAAPAPPIAAKRLSTRAPAISPTGSSMSSTGVWKYDLGRQLMGSTR